MGNTTRPIRRHGFVIMQISPEAQSFSAKQNIANNVTNHRKAYISNQSEILTDIYQNDSNIVVWERNFSKTLSDSIAVFLLSNPAFQLSITLSPKNAVEVMHQYLGANEQYAELSENIAELVDMFAYLFALKQVGLRLASLDRAMCPKFHVDRVPCRLITTYVGIATQWLPHDCVDRSKLGMGSQGLSDSQSGIYQNQLDIQQLKEGDVALLKGELWDGNENAGLVHRSPMVNENENRLLLTLDFND